MDDINKKSNDNVEIAITNSFCLSMCVSCFHLNSCVKLHIHLKYFNWESSKISGREREREINVGMEIQNIQLNMKHTMKEVNVHSVSQTNITASHRQQDCSSQCIRIKVSPSLLLSTLLQRRNNLISEESQLLFCMIIPFITAAGIYLFH